MLCPIHHSQLRLQRHFEDAVKNTNYMIGPVSTGCCAPSTIASLDSPSRLQTEKDRLEIYKKIKCQKMLGAKNSELDLLITEANQHLR
jgi:hypothetical protein